jgi:hypothetical protein
MPDTTKTTEPTAKVVESSEGSKSSIGFIPLPNLDQMRVGHAGAYFVDNEEEEETLTEVQELKVVSLGRNGTKIMLSVEAGIKTTAEELSKDKDNGLPNSLNGIFTHYFTKGIEKDFNIIFDEPPTSIREKLSKTAKAVKQGKRVLTKAQKNDIVAKCGWDYWSNLVSAGEISIGEAQSQMLESITQRTELEEKGLYFSKNKTDGVKTFDWKSVVKENVGADNAYKIYSLESVEILVPNIINTYYNSPSAPKNYIREGMKSPLFPTLFELAWRSGITTYGLKGEYLRKIPNTNKTVITKSDAVGGQENIDINTEAELFSFLELDTYIAGCKVNGIHLVKLKKSGLMKPRYVCLDVVSNKGRQLLLVDAPGSVMIIKENVSGQ